MDGHRHDTELNRYIYAPFTREGKGERVGRVSARVIAPYFSPPPNFFLWSLLIQLLELYTVSLRSETLLEDFYIYRVSQN